MNLSIGGVVLHNYQAKMSKFLLYPKMLYLKSISEMREIFQQISVAGLNSRFWISIVIDPYVGISVLCFQGPILMCFSTFWWWTESPSTLSCTLFKRKAGGCHFWNVAFPLSELYISLNRKTEHPLYTFS